MYKRQAGESVSLEIGERDPDRDDHDAIYARLNDVQLGEIQMSYDSSLGNRPYALVPMTNLEEGSRLAFDPLRFVRAKVHLGVLKVWMHNTYVAVASSQTYESDG